MTPTLETPEDAEAQARALLDEWAKRANPAAAADFGRKISIVSLRDKTAYAGFLRRLFDVRTGPVEKTLAYVESAPPKTADKGDIWAIPSGLAKQYLEQETTVVAAEPGEPSACNRCAGEDQIGPCDLCRGAKTVPCKSCVGHGRKSCPACEGRGAIVCAPCGGTGRVLQSMGADGARVEGVCPQCAGSKELPCHDCADAAAQDCSACGNKRAVTCPECSGRGAPLCPVCGGARRVVPGFSVAIAYKLAYHRGLLRDPSIPETVFPEDPDWGKLGEKIFEFEGSDAEALAASRPSGPAGEAFAKVLAMAPAEGLGENSRLLLQTLSVERVPIYDVTYSFEGKEHRAWATRFENRVVPLDDPFSDQAARLAGEAEALLGENDFTHFEERVAEAVLLAPKNPAVAALRGKAGAVQSHSLFVLGGKIAAGLAIGVPAVLAVCYKSPNRFTPLGGLALGIAGLSLAAIHRVGAYLAPRPLLAPKKRDQWAAGAAGGGAALALVLFLLVGPIRRTDAREFAGRLSTYAELPFASWTPSDDASLTDLVKDYGIRRGVDVTAGQDLLYKRARYLEEARAQAERDAAARRRAALLAKQRAEVAKKEAARQKALAAKRAAAQKAAAAKAAAAKAKAKGKKMKKKARTIGR
ncbi:MAG: hypothetical protein ACHQ49_03900 [Elusimicrobiota bacterium]